MEEIQPEAICKEKDLGVVFTNDLGKSYQCLYAYSKAGRVLGMIRTISSRNCSILYKSLVRLHLEYCSTSWLTHYKKDKVQFERFNIASQG